MTIQVDQIQEILDSVQGRSSIYRKLASSPLLLAGIGILIPLVGVILDFSGLHTSFERSGSLLVAFAIFCVYLNHHHSYDADDLSAALDFATNESKAMEEKLSSARNIAERKESILKEHEKLKTALESAKLDTPETEKLDELISEIKARGNPEEKLVHVDSLLEISRECLTLVASTNKSMERTRKRLTKVEFGAGFFGTLIWGFGNFLNGEELIKHILSFF